MSWSEAIERSNDLHALEQIIDKGKETFAEVWLALARIREARLYKATHATWETYCRERWGWSGRHANRLIAATTMAGEIGPRGLTERHARELARLPEGEREAAIVDAGLLPDVQREQRQPTVAELRDVVDARLGAKQPALFGQLGFGMPGAPRRDLSQWDTRPPTARRLVAWEAEARARLAAIRQGKGTDTVVDPRLDGLRVLEPSAGKGNLVRALRDAGAEVTAIELDPVRAEALGCQCVDFLEYAAKLGPGDHFDVCVMNPPYEKDQDLAHILAALSVAPVVVVLARLALLEGQARRAALWDQHSLTGLMVLSARESFEGDTDGTPKSAFAFFRLERGPGRSIIQWAPMSDEADTQGGHA
jgi:predicted RNA methylase